ncbi:hypothetical protein ACIJYB_02745 [Candidatus Pelagibacter bacterium nBUS_44]|uniref:hypothetical protein n=1 Tax=Candidatus Pelagibacter bacterium nBUS_44 TaxID=3374195 RepID=UPI003EBBBB74
MIFKTAFLKNILLLFFFVLFLIQVIFLMPSPYGDSVWFLKLSFNICRDNLFVGTRTGEELRYSENINWVNHGWLYQYLIAKFNYFCSLRGIFLFNFIILIFTSLVSFKILNKKENNQALTLLVILFISLLQISLQFRPEFFTIFISILLIFAYEKNYSFITGCLFAVLFYCQPTIFCFLGLFSLLFYFKKIFKNFIKISLGFFIFFILLTYIYPYSLSDYLIGLTNNSGTWVNGTKSNWLNDFYTYYIKSNFTPLWFFSFVIILITSIHKNYFVLLSLPFLYFFGPRTAMSNYVLIGIMPFLLISQYNLIVEKNSLFLLIKKKLFIFFLISTVFVGYGQYFSRNILSIYFFHNELAKTKNFINGNLNEIRHIPTFGFMISEKIKLNNQEIKTYNMKPSLDLFSVNGLINPCPSSNLNFIDPAIYIYNRKIFNSNAGYGIWICKVSN